MQSQWQGFMLLNEWISDMRSLYLRNDLLVLQLTKFYDIKLLFALTARESINWTAVKVVVYINISYLYLPYIFYYLL